MKATGQRVGTDPWYWWVLAASRSIHRQLLLGHLIYQNNFILPWCTVVLVTEPRTEREGAKFRQKYLKIWLLWPLCSDTPTEGDERNLKILKYLKIW